MSLLRKVRLGIRKETPASQGAFPEVWSLSTDSKRRCQNFFQGPLEQRGERAGLLNRPTAPRGSHCCAACPPSAGLTELPLFPALLPLLQPWKRQRPFLVTALLVAADLKPPPENAQCPRAQNLPKRWLMAGCWGAGRATLLELLLIGETEVLHSFGLGFWRQSGFKVHPCFVPGLAAAAMEGMRTGHLFSICFQSFVQSLS